MRWSLRTIVSNGATAKDLQTATMQYLTAQGATSGSLHDRWISFLRTSGFTGALNDMLDDFWKSLMPN